MWLFHIFLLIISIINVLCQTRERKQTGVVWSDWESNPIESHRHPQHRQLQLVNQWHHPVHIRATGQWLEVIVPALQISQQLYPQTAPACSCHCRKAIR